MIKTWEKKKLGDVCNHILAGGDVPKSNFSKTKTEKYSIPIFANGATNKGLYGYTDIGKIVKPSITVSARGTIGYSEMRDKPFYPVVRLIVLTPNTNVISLPFLKYVVSSIDFKNSGTSIPQLTVPMIKKYEFLTPSLPEQKRIVKILDEVFEKVAKAKENTEKNLKNAHELFKSYLQAVFTNKGEGWKQETLNEVLQKTETVDPGKNPNKEFIYIDVASVNKENLTIEKTTLIKGKDAPSRARKLIKTNDVIFATVRPTLRRIAIIPEELDKQVCSTGYFVLRAKEYLNSKLVFYFLRTNKFNEKMEKLQKGASYPAVTDSEVRSQIILFPKSKIEQKTIVNRLDVIAFETNKLQTIYQQKLADLEELKKSILQKAFNGELAGARS